MRSQTAVRRARHWRARIAPWLALLPAIIAGAACAAEAGPFPQRPVRWIVPFVPGGSIDLVGRVVSQKLSELWAQQVVLDNRGGAGGRLGVQAAALAAPDGYTQLLTLSTTLTVDRSLFHNLPYDPDKSFAPVSIIASTSQLLVSNPALPVRNVRELIALCKARPGQVNYGSSGAGGSLHLAMELFKSMTGIDIVHVPYKGGPPAAADLIAGQIAMLFFNTPAAMPYVKSGRVRALGVSTARRSALLPDVPTIAEGGVKGFDTDVWFGVAVPAGAPPEVIARTQRDLATVLAMPEVRARLRELGAEAVGTTPAEFAQRVKKESAMWAKVIQTANISLDH